MKNISITLASALSIAFTSLVVDKAIARPTKSQLPKVGFVKSPTGDVGCYYYLSQDKRYKNRIFMPSDADVIMNLDGKDVVLPYVDSQSSKGNNYPNKRVYRYKDIRITIVTSIDAAKTKSTSPDGTIDVKGTMEISNGKQSKLIRIIGDCG